jgi:hypothetical protein
MKSSNGVNSSGWMTELCGVESSSEESVLLLSLDSLSCDDSATDDSLDSTKTLAGAYTAAILSWTLWMNPLAGTLFLGSSFCVCF